MKVKKTSDKGIIFSVEFDEFEQRNILGDFEEQMKKFKDVAQTTTTDSFFEELLKVLK